MEGALIRAKRASSLITIPVVTHDHGYRFPASKLPPGTIELSIRAVGYDLAGPQAIDASAGRAATANLDFARPPTDVSARATSLAGI